MRSLFSRNGKTIVTYVCVCVCVCVCVRARACVCPVWCIPDTEPIRSVVNSDTSSTPICNRQWHTFRRVRKTAKSDYRLRHVRPSVYPSVSQPPGRDMVPGPGINYTGPRQILQELITNLNVILYLSTCHTVHITVLILFMIMPQLIINTCVSLMCELKKNLERYWRVNLLGRGPRLMKKEFTGPRSHKGWETLVYPHCTTRLPLGGLLWN